MIKLQIVQFVSLTRISWLRDVTSLLLLTITIVATLVFGSYISVSFESTFRRWMLLDDENESLTQSKQETSVYQLAVISGHLFIEFSISLTSFSILQICYRTPSDWICDTVALIFLFWVPFSITSSCCMHSGISSDYVLFLPHCYKIFSFSCSKRDQVNH
jgi:hypothetical protein